MHETPPLPGEKPEEMMTVEQIDKKIAALTAEIRELDERKQKTTTAASQKTLDWQIAQKLNERAGYKMRRLALAPPDSSGM